MRLSRRKMYLLVAAFNNDCGKLQRVEEFNSVVKYEANSGKGRNGTGASGNGKNAHMLVVSMKGKNPAASVSMERKKADASVSVEGTNAAVSVG